MERSSGILLHPTSLPGSYPIGDLGSAAYAWIDWLESTGVAWWQTLPINPPGFGGSPYQALSTFAGNPLLIAPDLLLEDGLVDAVPPSQVESGPVDFDAAMAWKQPMIEEAGRRLNGCAPLVEFRRREATWLEHFALFRAIKAAHSERPVSAWPSDLQRREPEALASASDELAPDIDRVVAEQFLFFDQWKRMRSYAIGRGVSLIGDLPFFVATDSVEFWVRPDLFDVDADGLPRTVAGVPPDDFSPTGQLWGNPQYYWEAHAREGFRWWIDRVGHLSGLVDLIRMDHFRAFADYWEVPASSTTAESGRWVPGPGRPLFEAARAALGSLPLFAEDLGEPHPIVSDLRETIGLPGMKVAQFSFAEPADPPSLWPPEAIGYTGTHDNDTAAGWWDAAADEQRERATSLEGVHGPTVAADLLQAVWESPAKIAIAPIQDLLGLGSAARMNAPGTIGPHNWSWRLGALPTSDEAERLLQLNEATQRSHPPRVGGAG